jgi:hypothetical protein
LCHSFQPSKRRSGPEQNQAKNHFPAIPAALLERYRDFAEREGRGGRTEE